MLLLFLSQSDLTISIAKYIVDNLYLKDNFILYLYAYSKYPKNFSHKWIKKDDFDENLDIIVQIFGMNTNDSLNILKSLNNNKLKIIKEEYSKLNQYNIYLDEEELEYFILNKIK